MLETQREGFPGLGTLLQRMRVEADTLELESGDKALAERMLAGDRQAFDVFFESHMPGLYRFTLARLRDRDQTREVVQTSIVKAIAHLETYRGEASLTAWLYTICRNEIHRCFRRRRRSPHQVELAEDLPEVRGALDSLAAGFADPETAANRDEVARLVHATLDHLPPHYGHALEWKYLDGLSVKEIARRLKLAPKAAESLLTRARAAFRDGYAAATRAPLTAWDGSSA